MSKKKKKSSAQKARKPNVYDFWTKQLTVLVAGLVSWTFLLLFKFLLGFVLLFVPTEINIPNPPVQSTVVDQHHYLKKSTIAAIDQVNADWRKTPEQLQIGLYITDNLPMSDLEDFANQTFRKWKVGYAGTDNGVLIVVAIEDRKFRIETSDNASIRLTDARAKRILDTVAPVFREEDYDRGIQLMVSKIGSIFYRNNQADWIVQETQVKSGFWAKVQRGALSLLRKIDTFLWYAVIVYALGWAYLFIRRLYRMIHPTKTMKEKAHVRFMDEDAWFEEVSSGSSSGTGSGSSFSSGLSSGSGWSGGGGGGGGASGSW